MLDQRSVVSLDGYNVAWAIDNRPVQLWTKGIIRELRNIGPVDYVNCTIGDEILESTPSSSKADGSEGRQEGQLHAVFRSDAVFSELGFSADARFLFKLRDRSVLIYSTDGAQSTRIFEFDRTVAAAALNADGRFLAVTLAPNHGVSVLASANDNVVTEVWDIRSRRRQGRIIHHMPASVNAISGDGQRLVAIGYEIDSQAASDPVAQTIGAYFRNIAEVWDLDSGGHPMFHIKSQINAGLSGKPASTIPVAFSNDGSLIAIDFRRGAIIIVSAATGTVLAEIETFAPTAERYTPMSGSAQCLGFSPDGRTLYATKMYDTTIYDASKMHSDKRIERTFSIVRQHLLWCLEDVVAAANARLPADRSSLSEAEMRSYFPFEQYLASESVQ
jgi:WD40 repeat protein